MQTIQDFAGSTDMWSTSAGGHLMKVVNLTGFTVTANFNTNGSFVRCVITWALDTGELLGSRLDGFIPVQAVRYKLTRSLF